MAEVTVSEIIDDLRVAEEVLRKPAPGISFNNPNLPLLIAEIATLPVE